MDAAVNVSEFPFVADMPKREKSKVGKAVDLLQEMSALCKQKGVLVPATFAATMLGLTRQRVFQLMEDGKLERVVFGGHPFIPEESLLEFAREERRNGRPPKVPESKKEIWQAARAYAKEVCASKKN